MVPKGDDSLGLFMLKLKKYLEGIKNVRQFG